MWQRYKIFINIHIGRYFISYAISDIHKLNLSLFLLMNLPLVYHIFCILSLTVNTCSKQFQASCWIQFYVTVFSTARTKWKIWYIKWFSSILIDTPLTMKFFAYFSTFAPSASTLYRMELSLIEFSESTFNSFVPNAPFSLPPENIRKP